MVPWWWLLITGFGGVYLGFMIAAIILSTARYKK